MDTSGFLFILQWGSLASALALFLIKYGYLLLSGTWRKHNNLQLKWWGWYESQDFSETSSPKNWERMERNNRITTAMWICVSISSLLFLMSQ